MALLDSGDNDAHRESVVFDGITAGVVAGVVDEYGHGTAVAQIIRSRAGYADIQPVNVLDDTGTGDSFQLLNGLIYCLWNPEPFDVVNASVTTAASDSCPSAMGRSVAFVHALCNAQATEDVRRVPLVIAAAGNDPQHPAGYPAVLPSAVVVRAITGDGELADYNSLVLDPLASVVDALGGTEDEPLGVAVTTTGPPRPLWGTSFATAFVTAAVIG